MSFLFPFRFDSLDEVVFEGRNQAYGAYQLRHDYQRNLASAGGFTLLLLALALLGWSAWRQLAPAIHPVAPIIHEAKPIKLAPPIVIEHPKVAKPALPPARPVATHQAPAIPTQVAKDNSVQPRPTPLPVTEVIDGATGPATTLTTVSDPGVSSVDDGGKTSSDASVTSTATEPFIAVEKMPEFAGGQEALLRYLRNHLHYPSKALAEGIGGRVFLSFVVQADGSISDVTVLKGLGYGLDEEAQRVVRQMPNWTPGYQSKHAVPVRFTLPITFQYQ